MYRTDQLRAIADLVNLVLAAAGCDEQVTEDDINDPDNAPNRLAELQELHGEVSDQVSVATLARIVVLITNI